MSPKAHILVVDDVADNRDILSRPFTKRGFAVTEADNGAAALDLIGATDFDLVFLDIAMPGLDGLEVLQRIRASHCAASLPVIMVTARTAADDVTAAFELGATDYVTKPLDLRAVVARTESHLARTHAERRLHDALAEITGLNRELRAECARRAEAEALALDLAHHDGLTALCNRRRFGEKLAAAIRAVDSAGGPLALLCLDLDGFKPVNDRFGHALGDDLLKAIADRLRGCVRDTDTVGRLGGDEFAVLLPSVADVGEACRIAERIMHMVAMPFVVGADEVAVGCSIGIATTTDPSETGDRLHRHADGALYQAKAAGRGAWRLA